MSVVRIREGPYYRSFLYREYMGILPGPRELSVIVLNWCVFIPSSLFFSFFYFFFWPGFRAARKEPQPKPGRNVNRVMLFVTIPLCGAVIITALLAWYYWQIRKIKKSASPRPLAMDTIEQSGHARKKPRNEYVFLPQYWRVCLVTLRSAFSHELESKTLYDIRHWL